VQEEASLEDVVGPERTALMVATAMGLSLLPTASRMSSALHKDRFSRDSRLLKVCRLLRDSRLRRPDTLRDTTRDNRVMCDLIQAMVVASIVRVVGWDLRSAVARDLVWVDLLVLARFLLIWGVDSKTVPCLSIRWEDRFRARGSMASQVNIFSVRLALSRSKGEI